MHETEITAIVKGAKDIGGMSGAEALVLGLVLFMVFNIIMILANMRANRQDKEKSSQRNTELVKQILTMSEDQKNAIGSELRMVKQQYHDLELKVQGMENKLATMRSREDLMQKEITSNKEELENTRKSLRKCIHDLKNCQGEDDD